MHDPIIIGRRTACLPLTAAAMAMVLAVAHPARAEPVTVDGQGWTSPAQYLAKAAAGEQPAPAMALAQPAPAPPSAPIASPSESLSLPVLPRSPDTVSVQAESTTAAQMARDMAVTRAEDTANASNDGSQATGEDQAAALPVRLSFLPGTTLHQKPTPPYDSAMQKARQAMEQGNVKPVKPERAACAAISAYQKRQLKDLQSDQQTLQALRAAVSQLGLQKQLSFLSGPDADTRSSKPPAAN